MTRFDVGHGSVDLDNVFSYHAPNDWQVGCYQDIREAGKALAVTVEGAAPPSPERTTALNKIREAVMWANAAIACNPPPEGQE